MLTRKQQELLLFIHKNLQDEGIPPSFDEMKDALSLKSKSGIHRLITALEERGFIRRLPNRARALEILRLPEGHDARHGNLAGGAAQVPQAQNMSALARRGFKPSVIDGGLSADANDDGSNIVSGEFGGNPQAAYDATFNNGGANSNSIPVMGRIAAGVPISAIETFSRSLTLPADMIGAGEHFALEVEGESMIEAGIHDGDTVVIEKTSSASVGDIVVALVDDEEATLKTFRREGSSIALEAANPAFKTRVFDANRIKVQGRLVALMRSYN